jgi:hypothetical protein
MLEYCNPAGYPEPDRTGAWARVKFSGPVRVPGEKKNSGSGMSLRSYPDPDRQLVTSQLFKIFLLFQTAIYCYRDVRILIKVDWTMINNISPKKE